MIEDDGELKECFGGGALQLSVCHLSKTFDLSYCPELWDKKSLEEKVHLKNSMIRITDYWWSKGYEERYLLD